MAIPISSQASSEINKPSYMSIKDKIKEAGLNAKYLAKKSTISCKTHEDFKKAAQLFSGQGFTIQYGFWKVN